jgi:hypothetical protein
LKRLVIFLFTVFLFFSGFAQQMTKIHGKVIDANTKEPLPFVNIRFLNTSIGSTTDFNGRFKLETQWGNEDLQASFVGYEPLVKNVKIGANQTINFNLQTTSINLESVTVRARKKRYSNKDNPSVD